MRAQLTFSKTAPIYERLRQAILTLDPEDAGFNPPGKVWGFLMETAYQDAVVTLVTIVDGTTSLYISNGGGFIGYGRHPAVQKAAKSLIITSEEFVDQMDPVEVCMLPEPGQVKFHALTCEGTFSAGCEEAVLTTGKHPFSSLFASAQAVITQVRLLEEARKKVGWDV